MSDEDEKCRKAATLLYHKIEEYKKRNPEYTVENMSEMAVEFAVMCGFDHPRTFVKYIEDMEYEQSIIPPDSDTPLQ
jgi:hypothetical protein